MRPPNLPFLGPIARALAHAAVPGRPVPLVASLEVTRRCPWRCAYCAAARYPDSQECTTQEWQEILEDLARSGCLAVSVTGGEPLLRDDLGAILNHARALGLRVSLNTSGAGLPRRQAILQWVSGVTLSLDGTAEVHDTLRGSGSFRQAMEAAALCRRHGVPVNWTAVLSRTSIPHLPEFLHLLRDLGEPVWFQPAYEELLRNPAEPDPETPSSPDLQRAATWILDARGSGLPVRNGAEDLEWWLGRRSGNIPQCQGGRWFVRVTHRGNLEICGLRSDPSPSDLPAREGIVAGMRRIAGRPNPCRFCPSVARAAFHRLAGASPRTLLDVASGYLRNSTRRP